MLGYFLAELYGYLPELVEYFLTMFGPTETVEFMEASDKPRPMVIRTNTLKARRKDLAAALIKRGVSLDPLASWSKVGLKIVESPVPMGATPEYLGGYYMLQSAASMCPVLALSPEPQEKVLDMSAAPGGKTSYIAQLMKNTGVIMANDLKAARQKATCRRIQSMEMVPYLDGLVALESWETLPNPSNPFDSFPNERLKSLRRLEILHHCPTLALEKRLQLQSNHCLHRNSQSSPLARH